MIYESFLFWCYLAALIFASIYVAKTARRIFEYEQRVDRGWDDLILRSEMMIRNMNDILFELDKTKKEIIVDSVKEKKKPVRKVYKTVETKIIRKRKPSKRK